MARIERTVDATAEPIDTAYVKEVGRILHTYEDTLIKGFITPARIGCEKQLGQSFVSQTWEMKLDRWPCRTLTNEFREIQLPYGPLQRVNSVTYYDANNSSTTMPSTDYIVTTGNVGRIAPGYNKYWPDTIYRPDAVTVNYTAGYGGAAASTDPVASVAAVPATIKHAVAVYVLHMYQVRDEDAPIPQLVTRLLDAASFGTHRMIAPDQR